MKTQNITILLFLIAISGIAIASDPRITGTNITGKTYYQETKTTVFIQPDGQTGNMNFWENGVIIQQKPFLTTDTNIEFIKTYLDIGTKELKFTITDATSNDNTENDQYTETIEIKKGIDFVITDLNTNTDLYISDQNLLLLITIKNEGDTVFDGNVPINIFYDNNLMTTIQLNNIGIGETKTVTQTINLPHNFEGTHTLKTVINQSLAIMEYGLTNNEKTKSITLSQKANLKINSLIIDANEIKKATPTKLTFYITNDGGRKAGKTTLNIFKDTMDETNKIFSIQISETPKQTTQEISFTYLFVDSGTKNIIAIIDPLNEINEENEEDNLLITTVEVQDTSINIDLSQYLANLSIIQGELDSCREEILIERADKQTKLTSLSRCENQLEETTTNLNLCNQNNATFLSNWAQERDNNLSQEISFLSKNYEAQLQAKTIEIRTLEANYLTRINETEKTRDLYAGIIIFMILASIAYFGKGRKHRGLIETTNKSIYK